LDSSPIEDARKGYVMSSDQLLRLEALRLSCGGSGADLRLAEEIYKFLKGVPLKTAKGKK
jgi:hypothetical protein